MTVWAAELPAANDALGSREELAGLALMEMSDQQIARMARKGFNLATRLYRAEDSVWKTYAYENEKARYREAFPEWSEEQVRQRAAEIVRDTNFGQFDLYFCSTPCLRRFLNACVDELERLLK